LHSYSEFCLSYRKTTPESNVQNQTFVFIEVIAYFERKYGAVAQLGERFVRNEEVVSSILISSTSLQTDVFIDIENILVKIVITYWIIYTKVGVLLISLGSSPTQQDIAQPRQIRKEATVSNQFCVT
jgi:hypothetical protein